MKYSVLELINNVCKNGFVSSEKNRQKVENCGFKNGEAIPLFGTYTMKLYGCHYGIRKDFFKGSRSVKKETVLKAYEREFN